MNFSTYLKTVISYFLIGLLGLVFMPPCILIAYLPARYRYDNRLFFFLADVFYKLVVCVSFNRLIIEGKENLPRSASVFVANHASAFDIPVLGSLCNGYPHVWLVMSYYINAPILGFFIKRMFVPVDQSDPSKAARSLIQVYRFVQAKKRHLLIFPEGGRYVEGINKFYEGFAIIAQKTGMPVIPVYMPNNGKIYPPHSFLIYSYPVIVSIGAPLYLKEGETNSEFVARVREWFLEQQKRYRS